MPRVYNQRKLLGPEGLVAAIFEMAIRDAEAGRPGNGCMEGGAFLRDEGTLDNLAVLGVWPGYYLRLLDSEVDVEAMQDERVRRLYRAGFNLERISEIVFRGKGSDSWRRMKRVIEGMEVGHDGN